MTVGEDEDEGEGGGTVPTAIYISGYHSACSGSPHVFGMSSKASGQVVIINSSKFEK